MNTRNYKTVYAMLDEQPVISSHEHHLPGSIQRQMSLDRILDYAYIGWYGSRKGKPFAKSIQEDPLLQVHRLAGGYSLPDDDWSKDAHTLREERAAFLDRFGFNSYWVWLEKGIQKIYGLSEGITPDNWEAVSARITAKHATPGADIDILKRDAGYLRAVQDTYWDYSSDLGQPGFFLPAMRVDMFITCYNADVLDHDLNNPFTAYPGAPRDNFEDYLAFLSVLFTGWREQGAVALKCASAYERPLSFRPATQREAAAIFGKPQAQVTREDRLTYGDFMFHWFCSLAIQLGVPFQVHTGLADISGSSPLLFEPVIRQYPQIRFVLFHAGYPWYSQLGGLAHNYTNVVMDMVWAPLISTSAAIQALKEYIEVAPTSGQIAWGGDTWTSEEAAGAVLAWKHVIACALAEMLESGYLDLQKAASLARKLMAENNTVIYGIKLG